SGSNIASAVQPGVCSTGSIPDTDNRAACEPGIHHAVRPQWRGAHSPMSWVTVLMPWSDKSRASHAAGLTTRSSSKLVSGILHPTLLAGQSAGATVLQHTPKAGDADEGRLRAGAGPPPGSAQAQ